MAKRTADPKRENFWRDVLARFGTSGLSVRAFCRQERLSEPAFYAWRRTIAQRDGQATSRRASPRHSARQQPKPPAFLPLVMRDGLVPLPTPAVCIELRGGRTLRLPESIEAERLAAIVHALERGEGGA